MYHHFGDDRYPSTNVRLEQFAAHIKFLEDSKFNIWPLDKIIYHFKNNLPIPDKTLAITMDDAYRTVYTHAYPKLKKRNWPFTVFVSTDYIDKGYSDYMTWAQMRQMEKGGASFGNHSGSHRHLIRHDKSETSQQWQKRVQDDIQKAQKRLDTELNNAVELFAYPYGEYSVELANIVAELGFTGLGQQSGAIGPHSDFRFLPRFPLAEAFAEIGDFTSKVNSLAMAIKKTQPVDPVIEAPRPKLTVTLAKSEIQRQQINCYISGQGRADISWLDKDTFQVQAENDLPPGRSRYNCTAPSSEKERFYWFSQLWIRPGGNGAED